MRADVREVLKIAAGVFLGLTAFWLASIILSALTSQGAQERNAQGLLQRQFAPAH
ncbi:hypothetical protein D9M73_62870 [compost metagenome]